jgi:hypothetical protein
VISSVKRKFKILKEEGYGNMGGYENKFLPSGEGGIRALLTIV